MGADALNNPGPYPTISLGAGGNAALRYTTHAHFATLDFWLSPVPSAFRRWLTRRVVRYTILGELC